MLPRWLSNKTKMEPVELASPLTGTVVPLERVPDEAFAGKHMGDGLAVEPAEGILVAPCDGRIVYVIHSKHAIIIEHESGLQLLIHIGLNTVALKGEGFLAHVTDGDHVMAGQKLISFDLDFIRASGYKAITPMVIANGEMAAEIAYVFKKVKAGEPSVMKVMLQS